MINNEEYINYKEIYENKKNQPKVKYNFLEVSLYVILMILIVLFVFSIAFSYFGTNLSPVVPIIIFIYIVIVSSFLSKIRKDSKNTGNGMDLIYMDANPNIINLPYLVDNFWTSLGYKELSKGLYCKSKTFKEKEYDGHYINEVYNIRTRHYLADYNLKVNIDNDNNKVYIMCWFRYEGYYRGAEKKVVTIQKWTSPYPEEFQADIDKFYELLTNGQ